MEKGAGALFVVTAPSGAGKTTLCQELIRGVENIRCAVSHTTRKPRPKETNGVNYHFVSEEKFQEMIDAGRFFEWARIHGNFYGTSVAEYEKARDDGVDLLLEIEGQGAMQVKKRHPGAVLIFIVTPRFADLKARLDNRGKDAPDEIERRMQHAKQEISFLPEFEYVIINDDFDEALKRLMSIVYARRSLRETMMKQLNDEYKAT